MCSLCKEQSILSRKTIQNAFFFFFLIMPLVWLRLLILYQAPHSGALGPTYSALVDLKGWHVHYGCHVHQVSIVLFYLSHAKGVLMYLSDG